jgi:hypothetical protein
LQHSAEGRLHGQELTCELLLKDGATGGNAPHPPAALGSPPRSARERAAPGVLGIGWVLPDPMVSSPSKRCCLHRWARPCGICACACCACYGLRVLCGRRAGPAGRAMLERITQLVNEIVSSVEGAHPVTEEEVLELIGE